MKLLLTGSTRSGQTYASVKLREAGLNTGLETVWGLTGFTGWRDFDASVTFCAVPWLHTIDPAEVYVVHLVREPLAVMNSMIGRKFLHDDAKMTRVRRFLRTYCPQAFERESLIERAAIWWLLWNQWVEPYADDLLRIEDWGESTMNSFARANYTWDDLPRHLRDAVIAQAEGYGYPPP